MRAIFLDRDGVLNRKPPEGQYITRWECMELLPGSLEAVARLAQGGFQILVVTNQRGLALGKVKEKDLEFMHANLERKMVALGAKLEGIYVCPHDVTAECPCRKPRPGLLLAAAREHDLDLSGCWMVGDSPSDVLAGRAAGCRTALIRGTDAPGNDPGADVYGDDLSHAADQILAAPSVIRERNPISQANHL